MTDLDRFDVVGALVFVESAHGFDLTLGCFFNEYDAGGHVRELFFEGPGAAYVYARARGYAYVPFPLQANRVLSVAVKAQSWWVEGGPGYGDTAGS